MVIPPKAFHSKAIVTGDSSGIGAAVADRLLDMGYRVVGLSRRAWAGDGRAGHARQSIDLSDLDLLPARLDSLAREHDDCELVVCCAGRGDFGSLEQLSYQRIRSLIELNLIATAFVCKAFVPVLKRRGGGQLVLVGSEAALSGRARGSVYCASKFGLRGFAQALREEGAKSGLRVSSIHPGMVRTPFFDDLDFEPGEAPENALQPAEVADAVALVVSARPGAVFDEIELSPLKKVVRKKHSPRAGSEKGSTE